MGAAGVVSPPTNSVRSWESPRFELDEFLKHQVESYTAEDFEHEITTILQIEELRKAERRG